MMEISLDKDEYSPLVLAYIGDAVHELYIRTRLIANANLPVNTLHRAATSYVNAKAQFEAFHLIEPHLTEDEIKIFKRGRNAKSATTPKNAEIVHYRHATGFEALLGYLYINNQKERLSYILDLSYNAPQTR